MKYLFIYAHLDDETILSYGTILKLLKQLHNVSVLTICGQGRSDADNAERLAAWEKILNDIRVECFTFNCNDLSLTPYMVKTLLNVFDITRFDVIVTHSSSDMHFEHRLLNEEILLKCRTLNSLTNIKKLLATTSPSVLLTHNLFNTFKPNVFVDISEFIEQKQLALKEFSMEFLQQGNDIRSVESIINWNKMYGHVINVDYCEPYELIYSIV